LECQNNKVDLNEMETLIKILLAVHVSLSRMFTIAVSVACAKTQGHVFFGIARMFFFMNRKYNYSQHSISEE